MQINEMKDYGLNELEEQADWILDQEPANIYELTDLTFESVRLHGGLVENNEQALRDIDEDYSLKKVFAFMHEMGVDMATAAKDFTAESIHTAMVERDFIEYADSVYKEVDRSYGNELTDQEKTLATILKIKDENQMTFDTENRPEVKALLSKTQSLAKKNDFTVSKTAGKGMER